MRCLPSWAWAPAGFLGTILAGVACAAEPEPAPSLGLDDAVRLALQHNPTLRAARARVEAADGRAWQAGRWANPSVEFAVEDWPVDSSGGFSDAKQTVGVVQTLPWPGKKPLERRIGRFGVLLSEEELRLRRTEIVRDTKAAFYGVLAAEGAVAAGEELLRVAETSARVAAQRVAAGAMPYQEQLRAEIQLDQVQTEVAVLRRNVGPARQTLATVMGRSELGDLELRGELGDAADADVLAISPNDWMARHPSMALARAVADRAELTYRRERLTAYPDVTAGLAGGRLGETDRPILELAFSVPLPVWDASQGRRREAAADLTVAEAEVDAMRGRLMREWIGATERYRSANDQVAAYRERILPKSDEALRLVQRGFEEGKFGFIDLLDTQRTAAETRLGYQRRLLELNLARCELEALLSPQPRPSADRTEESPQETEKDR